MRSETIFFLIIFVAFLASSQTQSTTSFGLIKTVDQPQNRTANVAKFSPDGKYFFVHYSQIGFILYNATDFTVIEYPPPKIFSNTYCEAMDFTSNSSIILYNTNEGYAGSERYKTYARNFPSLSAFNSSIYPNTHRLEYVRQIDITYDDSKFIRCAQKRC